MRLTKISELVLVRHGETIKNLIERKSQSYFYQNPQDRERVGSLQDRFIPLTKKGLAESKKLGRELKDLFGVPDCIFHSGFERTKQTAEQILKAYKQKELRQVAVKECHLVRERNAGYLWTFTQDEVRELFPWWGTYFYTADPFSFVPLGGESIAQMCEGRLTKFLWQLEDLPSEGGKKYTVFIISHGRAIIGLRYLLEGWNYDTVVHHLQNVNPLNCSITSYSFDQLGRPILSLANKSVIKFSQ